MLMSALLGCSVFLSLVNFSLFERANFRHCLLDVLLIVQPILLWLHSIDYIDFAQISGNLINTLLALLAMLIALITLIKDLSKMK